jgi:hypothetical protein
MTSVSQKGFHLEKVWPTTQRRIASSQMSKAFDVCRFGPRSEKMGYLEDCLKVPISTPFSSGEVFRTLPKIIPLESSDYTPIFPDLSKSSLFLCQAKSKQFPQISGKLLKIKQIEFFPDSCPLLVQFANRTRSLKTNGLTLFYPDSNGSIAPRSMPLLTTVRLATLYIYKE